MRVTLVTQWFPPEPAGVPAGYADGLAARGHDVHVLTGLPNYPTGVLADGYRIRPYQRERRDSGVVVHRAPLLPSHDASAVRRAGNYLSFAAAAAVVAQRLPRPDVWLTYSSPVTATLPALVAGRLDRLAGRAPARQAQVIQDLWPDSVLGSGMVSPGAAARTAEVALGRYCHASYRASSAVGVISPSMRELLGSRGVPDHVVVDTPNWVPDPGTPTPHPAVRADRDAVRAALGLPTGRLFLYAGNLGELQALDALVDTFAANPQAQLVLMGDGVARPRLLDLVARRGLANLHLLTARPADQIGAVLAAADVLVVSLADTPLLRATMPSKLAACLAAGRPVLAHTAGDVADVVRGSGAGLAASPSDPVASRAAVAQFVAMSPEQLAEHGRVAREVYLQRYTPAAGLDALERLLAHATRPLRLDPTPTTRSTHA